MEPPSAALHRGRTSCQGLLLTASLLTFWNVPPCVSLQIEPEPFNSVEGDQVIFQVNDKRQGLRSYHWFKVPNGVTRALIIIYEPETDKITRGPNFSGRETVFQNGSLRIRNVTRHDQSLYHLQTIGQDNTTVGADGRFFVYNRLPKPSVTANNTNPVENKDRITFTCDPELYGATYSWYLRGRNIRGTTSRLQLSRDRRVLTVARVTRKDVGPYECENSNPGITQRSDPLTLDILYGPENATIYPPDTYFKSGTDIWLSCEVTSNPAASVTWLRNEVVQLENSKELIISKSTSEHTGTYTCLAQNTATGLNTSTTKNIEIFDPIIKPSIHSEKTTFINEKDIVVLSCHSDSLNISTQWKFNDHPLELKERMILTPNNRTLSINPVRMEDAGVYHCQVSNFMESMESDPFSLAVIKEAPQKRSRPSRWTTTRIVYSALPLMLLLLLLLLLLLFLTRSTRKEDKGKEGKKLKKQKQQPEKKGEAPKRPAGVNAQKPKQPAEKPLPHHPQKK